MPHLNFYQKSNGDQRRDEADKSLSANPLLAALLVHPTHDLLPRILHVPPAIRHMEFLT
jgi:hypothetical protein